MPVRVEIVTASSVILDRNNWVIRDICNKRNRVTRGVSASQTACNFFSSDYICLLGTLKCTSSSLLLLLDLFSFQLSLSTCHQPIKHHLSWSSSCSLSLHFSFIDRFSSESPLSMCSIHFLCLFLTVCIRRFSPPFISNTWNSNTECKGSWYWWNYLWL